MRIKYKNSINYVALDKAIKENKRGWFKNWCEREGVEYNKIKQALYRYRQDDYMPPEVTDKVTDKVTLTDLIEKAQREMENDSHNVEYSNFIKRATGKDQYLIRTTIKLFNKHYS